jgi:hypothetical protein
MKPPWIKVRRYPYEEPYHTHIFIWVSNGLFMGGTDFYCHVDDLQTIGEALQVFPRSVPDEYNYEYGGKRREGSGYFRYFLLRASTINRSGHCAIQVIIDLNEETPTGGNCEFSFHIEPLLLNRLGHLFSKLHRLEHGEFHWNNNSALIFEDHREMEDDALADIPKIFLH